MADMIPQVYPLFAAYQYMRRLRYGRIIYWSSDKPHVLFDKADGTVDQIEEAFLRAVVWLITARGPACRTVEPRDVPTGTATALLNRSRCCPKDRRNPLRHVLT